MKDPRSSPARPFYIGKGVGTRAWDHLLVPDATRKGQLIAEIKRAGREVLVTKVSEDLTELQAIKLEAELIAAFGLAENGGLLLNSVRPSGAAKGRVRDVVLPTGALEKAQLGLSLLLDAVLELAKANPKGVTNAEVQQLRRGLQRLFELEFDRPIDARGPVEARRSDGEGKAHRTSSLN